MISLLVFYLHLIMIVKIYISEEIKQMNKPKNNEIK